MAYYQDRRVGVGELLTGTFQGLASIKRELAIYFAAFLVAGLIADFLEVLRGPINIATTIGYFAGQYYLYRAVLRQAGIIYDDAFKGFSFFLMAMILGVALYFSLIFFVVPAILLGAKWIMAPTYLVAEKGNLFDAIGASWRASSKNLLPLAMAFIVIWLIWLGLQGLFGGVSGASDTAAQGAGLNYSSNSLNAFGWIISHLLPVMLMGLSVSAYRALSESQNSLVAVFE